MPLESIVGVVVFAIANLLFLLMLFFMLWMAVDAAKGDKYWWIVLILGVPLVGSIVYYFVEKKRDYSRIEEQEI